MAQVARAQSRSKPCGERPVTCRLCALSVLSIDTYRRAFLVQLSAQEH